MSYYILATPDRYGRLGHQTSSIATGILLASITGAKLILPRYMFFCDKWNQFVDFKRCQYVAADNISAISQVAYIERENSDNHGNRKWDLSTLSGVKAIVAEIASCRKDSLICLPFDQQPGLLLRLVNQSHVRNEFRKAFDIKCSTDKSSLSRRSLVIHIRRGDCNPQAHPYWHIKDSFYMHLFLFLKKRLPFDYRIAICTQGDTDWIRDLFSKISYSPELLSIQSTEQLFTNDSEVRDFSTMVNADILIGASSGFSRWANVIGSPKISIDITRDKNGIMSCVKCVNPDLSPAEIFQELDNAFNSGVL